MAKSGLLKWAQKRAPNYFLVFCNLAYLALAGISLSVGIQRLQEVADDFRHNPTISTIRDIDPTNRSAPVPCGLPTPDMLHLLTAFDQYNDATQFLQANYEWFAGDVRGALCGSNYKEWEDWDPDDSDKHFNRGRYVYILATIAERYNLLPPIGDATERFYDARDRLNVAMCDRKQSSRLYSLRQETVYGELRERAARAYITAAPAFYRYWNSINDATPAGCFNDLEASERPFLGTPSTAGAHDECMNFELIQQALENAASDKALKRLVHFTGDSELDNIIPQYDLPEPQEMLVALFALSLIGHVDRTKNAGKCFRYESSLADPTTGPSALDFCETIFDGKSLTVASSTDTPMKRYAEALGQYSIFDAATNSRMAPCNGYAGVSPPPPAPAYTRATDQASGVDGMDAIKSVCAESMQYGLFNQEKLFGIPDPIADFAADARDPRWGHFISHAFIEEWWTKAVEHVRFNDPIWRLEAYLAYRLAMTAYWGMLVGSVIGYFLGRSFLPFAIQLFACIGVARKKNGATKTMVRPEGVNIIFILAVLSSVLTGYWLIWIDPSTQSHVPITPACNGWAENSPHSSSGVYVTTWSKPRYNMLPAAALGPLIIGIAVLAVLISAFDQCFGIRKAQKSKKTQKMWDRIKPTVFFFFFLTVLVVQGLLAALSGVSGKRWQKDAIHGETTYKSAGIYVADSIVAVYASFWTAFAVAWIRGRWTLAQLSNTFKWIWVVVSFVLIWSPVIIGASELPEGELEDAFSDDPHDRDRQVVYAVLVLVLVGQSIFLIFMSRQIFVPDPDEGSVVDAKDKALESAVADFEAPVAFFSPEVQRLMDARVLEHMPVHDAVGHPTGSATLADRAYGAFRIAPTGALGYRPMLRAKAATLEP